MVWVDDGEFSVGKCDGGIEQGRISLPPLLPPWFVIAAVVPGSPCPRSAPVLCPSVQGRQQPTPTSVHASRVCVCAQMRSRAPSSLRTCGGLSMSSRSSVEEIGGWGGSETASEGTASAFRSNRRAGASTCVLCRSWGLLSSPMFSKWSSSRKGRTLTGQRLSTASSGMPQLATVARALTILFPPARHRSIPRRHLPDRHLAKRGEPGQPITPPRA